MKTKFMILLFFSLSAIPLIYAEESNTFEIDGYTIITNNPNVSAIDIDWDSEHLPEFSVNFTEPYTGQFQIQIPKNMPRTMNLDFETTLMIDVSSLSGKDLEKDWNEHIIEKDFKMIDDRVSETESLCYYIITVELSEMDYFKVGTGSVASGRWEPVTIENKECNALYDELTFQHGSVFPRHGYQPPNILSPLKQFNSGIAINEIQCRENLVLLQKHDGSPACVTESTKEKLVERSWVKNECARLFDSNMNAYSNHAQEQREKGVVWTPPTFEGLILNSDYFEEWRNYGCIETINNWKHLSENASSFTPHVLNKLENEN